MTVWAINIRVITSLIIMLYLRQIAQMLTTYYSLNVFIMAPTVLHGIQLKCLLKYLRQIAQMLIMLSTVDSSNAYYAIYGRQLICLLCYLWYKDDSFIMQSTVASSNAYYAIYGRQLKCLLCYLRQITHMLIMLSTVDSSNAYYAIYSRYIAHMLITLSRVESSNAYALSTVDSSYVYYAIYSIAHSLLCYLWQIAQMFIMLVIVLRLITQMLMLSTQLKCLLCYLFTTIDSSYAYYVIYDIQLK